MLHYLLQMLQQYWSDSSGPNTQELKKNCANSSGCNTSSDKKEFAIVLTPSPNSVIPCHATLWKVGAITELILIQKQFPKHQHFSFWHVAPSVCVPHSKLTHICHVSFLLKIMYKLTSRSSKDLEDDVPFRNLARIEILRNIIRGHAMWTYYIVIVLLKDHCERSCVWPRCKSCNEQARN